MKRLFLLLSMAAVGFSALAQTPTWSDDVARIMYANCTSCHHPGGIGPTPWMTYQDVLSDTAGIRNAIDTGFMPPWTPDPNYKHFAHERVLPAGNATTIIDWINAGAPSGDLRFAPPAPTYTSNSQLGTVDLTKRITTYTVTSNNDEYHNFVLPSGLTSSKYATAMEIIPGNTQIVHHVLVFQDSTNNPINPNSAGGTGSAASQLIFTYVPGAQPYFTPVGAGIRLAANTRIILQIHYAPGSQGMVDSTRINFKLSTTTLREIKVRALLNHFTSMTNGPLSIPANQTRTFNEQAAYPGNWTMLFVFPHMHLIARSIKSYATTLIPNDTIRFVNIPAWDFHWQDNFVFPNAVKLPNGATIKATAFYDNTSNNPYNPNFPPQNVTAGEQTTDEMMLVFFAYMPYMTGDENLIIDKRIQPKGATTFCSGQSVLLTALEGVGYTYQWSLNGTPIPGATASSYNATVGGSYTMAISLGPNTAVSDPVIVTVNSVPTATIVPPGSTVIPAQGSIVLTAGACPGCSFQWYLNGVLIPGATASSYTATLPGDYVVETYNGCYAVSAPQTLTTSAAYAVTTTSNPPSGGSTAGAGSYSLGASVTVTATPNNGYSFVDWTENGSQVSTNASYSFTLSSNRVLEANFVQNTVSYNVMTASNPANGGVTTGGGTFVSGSNVTVTATPNNGYSFVDWTENGTQVSTNASYSFTLSGNRVLDANFVQNTVSFNVMTASNPANGGVTTGGGAYLGGSNVTVTATPNNGFSFVDWTANGNSVSTNTSFSFVLGSDTNLTANFVPVTGMDLGDNGFSLFPNPSSGHVTIASSADLEAKVFNALGQLVQAFQVTERVQTFEIQETGLYLLQLQDAQGRRFSRQFWIAR